MPRTTALDSGGPFSGRSALVIGGSRGLGRAVALALSREGARVLATGRNRAALEELGAIARARGTPLLTLRSDAEKKTQVRAAFRRAASSIGGPDLLVHAAGDYWEGPFRRLAEHYVATSPLINENVSSSVGLIAGLGFLLLLLRALLRGRSFSELDTLGRLAVAGVLLGGVGGLGTTFSYLVNPQIHGYNRLSIWLALFGLVAVGLVLRAALARVSRPGTSGGPSSTTRSPTPMPSTVSPSVAWQGGRPIGGGSSCARGSLPRCSGASSAARCRPTRCGASSRRVVATISSPTAPTSAPIT